MDADRDAVVSFQGRGQVLQSLQRRIKDAPLHIGRRARVLPESLQ